MWDPTGDRDQLPSFREVVEFGERIAEQRLEKCIDLRVAEFGIGRTGFDRHCTPTDIMHQHVTHVDEGST